VHARRVTEIDLRGLTDTPGVLIAAGNAFGDTLGVSVG
jgi:hypothetical protein